MGGQMLSKPVDCGWLWLEWLAAKMHVHVLRQFPSLSPIAGRARRDNICPNMLAAEPARNDMINGHHMGVKAAILAYVLISPEYLSLR
jgi:hypothetical protein